ncbi:MAG: NADH-quinone oxidoreductase subunit NuoK [candidate division Zixibacteria bacterium]|nr:NADH-quinone oxidoreductase subunit NuoK [candidate division Zixibacteria bacterium]
MPIAHYLILGGLLFAIGAVGVIVSRNLIVMFMSIELMLNAANLAIIAFSRSLNLMDGHVFVFLIMAVAAAEAAVGLAIIIAIFRNRETINADKFNLLRR